MDYAPPAPVPQGLMPLQPIPTNSNKPPKRRIPNASAAQTIVTNLWQANVQRNIQWAAMQGQIDGNPPYSPIKLRAVGRGSDPNFNTLEAKAIRSAALVPYFDLFAGGNRYVEVKLAPPGQGDTGVGYGAPAYNGRNSRPDPNFDPVRLSEDSGIVSEEYDRMLRRWTNYENVMHTGITDYVTFGRMHLPWESHDSWRFRRVAYHRVLVPDATPLDNEELEIIILLNNFTTSRLYGMIRNEGTAKAAGWNVRETMDAIRGAVPVDPAIPQDALATQQMIKDGDIYIAARSATVQTATIYVKEYSGKWSELVIRRDQIPGTVNATDDGQKLQPQFMFEAYERYDSVEEVMTNFFFESSGGTWNGCTGLANDIFTLMQLKDRMACTQAHSVMLRNSLVLQPKTAGDSVRANLLQVGALTIVPAGLDVLQSTILGDITSTIEVSRELSQMVERNTGIYRPTLEKTSGNPDTLGEFQMKFAQATVLSTSAINRFYSQMDRLYESQWTRVLGCGMKRGGTSIYETEAQEFVKRCEARGVSREQLRRLASIRAFRNIGQGSQAMRQQTLQNFMPLYPLLPANGQENLLEDIIRTAGSQHQVERYMPDADRRKLPSDQQAWALVENAAIKVGAPVTWTPSQNNIIHAQTHLQAGAQAAQSVSQGASPFEVVGFIDGIGAHVAVHLEKERANPMSKDAVKLLEQQWKQLAGVNDKLKQAIMAMPKQQEQLATKKADLLTDADVKRLDVQLKNQLSREKAMGTLQLKGERQKVELALKQQKQEFEQALKATNEELNRLLADASTGSDIQRKAATTQADMQMEKERMEHDKMMDKREAEAETTKE